MITYSDKDILIRHRIDQARSALKDEMIRHACAFVDQIDVYLNGSANDNQKGRINVE
jgi:hypothetical protein